MGFSDEIAALLKDMRKELRQDRAGCDGECAGCDYCDQEGLNEDSYVDETWDDRPSYSFDYYSDDQDW